MGEMDGMFTSMSMVIGVIGALVVGIILFGLGKAFVQWQSDNASPVEKLAAAVVAKRTEVSGGSGEMSARTSYFVTFELYGGERREFAMGGSEFGQFAEGDRGTLQFQGSRFLEFDRTPRDLGH